VNGTVNPGGLSTTWYFQWGLTTGYGGTTVGGTFGTNGDTFPSTVSEAETLSGLTPGATYHYRIVGTNAAGTTYGVDASFTTNGFPNPPTLTSPANGVANSIWQTGQTFAWTYNTGGAGGGQTQYAIKVTPAGGADQWWTGSAWAGTETWIVSAAGSVAIAAGNFSSIVSSYQWTVNTKDANGTGTYASAFTVINEIPPAAPTLVSPANASYADLSGTPTFVWGYNPTNGDSGQLNWAVRRKISGSSTYSYYNAGSASWQSTIVWNPGSGNSFVYVSGLWVNGNTYNWSMALQDDGGQGPFAADFTVVAEAPPTVSVTSPSGTITSLLPVVAWSATFPGGAGETAYQVRTFTAAQYGIGGFNPATSPAIDDSGVVGGSAVSYQVATTLNPGAYKSYVNVTETGGVTNAFNALGSFTTAVDTPNAPGVTATATVDGATGCPMIQVQVACSVNILSAVDSSFETGIGTWGNIANCTLTQSATFFIDGAFSLRMSSTAAGDMQTNSGSTYPVAPSTAYTSIALLRAGSVGRNTLMQINWFTSVGVLISIDTGTTVADVVGSWTQIVVNATSPSNAAFASLTVLVKSTGGAGELHYVDLTGLFPAPVSAWCLGGFLATAGVIITRSDGVNVRLASPANPALLSNFPLTQIVTVNDYEVTPLKAYTYTALIQATGGSGVVQSPSSAPSGASVSTTKWWEFDPTDPTTAVSAQPITWNPSNTEQSASHVVLGQVTMNVVSYSMQNTDMTATIETFDQAVYTKFRALAVSQKTIFFSSPFGAGYYFRIAPGGKAHDTQLLASTSAGPHQTIAVVGVAQPRPPV
jgi:hypothetical protein